MLSANIVMHGCKKEKLDITLFCRKNGQKKKITLVSGILGKISLLILLKECAFSLYLPGN